jgi:hypothetical protein
MNYSLVANNDLLHFQRERVLVNARKKVMSFKNNQRTSPMPHLLGAFAVSHPQISTIPLAQMSLLMEVRAVVEEEYLWIGTDFA